MRIAVIGAGNVGGSLGRRWAELGHDVRFGVRQPSKASATASDSFPPGARVIGIAEAVRDAEAVVLATPWSGAADVLRAAGSDGGALDGMPLLDATNPIGVGLTLDVGPSGESGAERLQRIVPKAHVVKIFNTTGFENMLDPVYDGASAMFFAGDNARAKDVARALATALGFEAFDVGALVRARELEHLAILWISLATGAGGAQQLGRTFALRIVRR